MNIKNIHPGEILKEDFLESSQHNATTLAKKLHISPSHLERILAGQAPITAKIAKGLAKTFAPGAHFWLGLQHDYEEMEMTK